MTERKSLELDALAAAAGILDRDAGAIDAAFATAGGELSQALAVFDPTIQGLSAISDRLLGEEMSAVGASLQRIVRELRALGGLLPEDVHRLKVIDSRGERATQSFGRLLNDTRLITAVTRSARIEAARLSTDAWQGGGFFDQIGAQAIPAIETIKACARDHAEVAKSLAQASSSLQGFATAYAPAVISLAARLEAMVPAVEAYRRGSLAATDAASRQSRKVTDSLGEAIVALQGGDSTRQRLEHAVTGLRLLTALASGTTRAPAGLSDLGRRSLDVVLRRVVSVQLHATAARMARDAQVVDHVLEAVAREVETTVQLSQSLGDRESAGNVASLSRFEGELRKASELIGGCKTALANLEQVTKVLTGAITQFRDAAADLREMVGTIVLIGMNASLNSSRLGDQGRVLSVIAHEIKSIADGIATGTEQLLPIFNEMQTGAQAIDERGAGRIVQLHALDQVVDGLLTTMQESRSAMGLILGGLAQDSNASAGAIRQALAALSASGSAVTAMTDAAALLDAPCVDESGADVIATEADGRLIEAFINQALWQVYTMEEERRLHREALEAFGITMAATEMPIMKSAPVVADAFEDFLL